MSRNTGRNPARAGAAATTSASPALTLRSARIAYESGRFAEAERILSTLVDTRPVHVDAIGALAIVRHAAGRTDAALATLDRALAEIPSEPGLLRLRAELRAAAGDNELAIQDFERALAVRPRDPDALFGFANALIAADRHGDARKALESALELSPGDVEIHLNLGNVIQDLGDPDAAERCYRRALALDPDYLPALINLADLKRAGGASDKAVALYDAALAKQSDLFEALFGSGVACDAAGRTEDALARLNRALELRPRSPAVLTALATAEFRAGQFAAAVDHFAVAAEVDPASATAALGHGRALAELDREAEAMARFDHAIALADDWAEPYFARALVAQRRGHFEACADDLRHAIAREPDHVGALSMLAEMGFGSDDQTERLGTLARDGKNVDDRAVAHFALGGIEDRAGRTAQAFEHYRAGNALRAERLNYSLDRLIDEGRRIRKTCRRELFAALAHIGVADERPVFVVGMQRSGTTLIERVVAAHPDAAGGGEMPTIRRIARRLQRGSADRPSAISKFTKEGAADLAAIHLDALTAIDPRARRIVDKMPSNFLYLGVIAVLFPNARVVHCRRDPMDTLLSCYTQNFGVGARFSYAFDTLAGYYRLYREMMDHWAEHLPLEVHDVVYENFVTDTEREARALIAFLDLPWDAACLDFHRAEGTVKTTSVLQVRRPVYADSVGRWRRYAAELEPLRAAVADLIEPMAERRT